MEKTDKQLQQDVLAELAWEPMVDAAHIGVTAENGIVTLTGHTKSYAEKVLAEQAARRVKGLRAIAQEIDVRFAGEPQTDDDEVADRIAKILEWDSVVPHDRIQVKVEHGWVGLTGSVDWQYQKSAAEKDATKISGVKGVTNAIRVQPRIEATDIRPKIEQAFKRNAELEASGITVETQGTKVILGGKVRAFFERDVAEKAAWSAPGVTEVEDNIILGWRA